MSEDEVAAIDEVVEAMSARVGRKIHRGHVIAFMAFRTRDQLQGKGKKIEIPSDVKSFAKRSAWPGNRSERVCSKT
jgi:hypothetical protein